MSKSDLQTRIRSINKKGQTGILRVRALDWPDHDLFFMGGELIACGCPDDLDAIGALLVAVDAVASEALGAVRDSLQEGEDLADELVQRGGVSGAAVMAARQKRGWNTARPRRTRPYAMPIQQSCIRLWHCILIQLCPGSS